jgi:hypothetical protein
MVSPLIAPVITTDATGVGVPFIIPPLPINHLPGILFVQMNVDSALLMGVLNVVRRTV